MKGKGKRDELNRQLASFLRRWAKHTNYIHDLGCDCRAFEKQAALFIKELCPPVERQPKKEKR
jgi:hypothetical protein